MFTSGDADVADPDPRMLSELTELNMALARHDPQTDPELDGEGGLDAAEDAASRRASR